MIPFSYLILLFSIIVATVCGSMNITTSTRFNFEVKSYTSYVTESLIGSSKPEFDETKTSVSSNEGSTNYSDRAKAPTTERFGNTVLTKTNAELILNVSDIFQNDQCSAFSSCVDKAYWYCYCDEGCHKYRDCCLNASALTKTTSQYTCTSISSEPGNFWGVQTLTFCPANFKNKTVVGECLSGDVSDVGPPVIDKDEQNLYKNKFCAMCNEKTNVVPLDLDFFSGTGRPILPMHIKNMLEMSELELQTYLYRYFHHRIKIPIVIHTRFCFARLVENEDVRCQQYTNPTLHHKKNVIYRNSFCLPENEPQGPCFQSVFTKLPSPYDTNDMFKLSVIFSFKTWTDASSKECAIWNQQSESSCKDIPTVVNAPFVLEYYIHLPDNSSTHSICQIGLLTIFVKEVDGIASIEEDLLFEVDESNSVLKITAIGTILKKSYLKEAQKAIRSINRQNITIVETGNTDQTYKTVYPGNCTPRNFKSIWTPRIEYNGLSYGLTLYKVKTPSEGLNQICDNVVVLARRINGTRLEVESLKCIQETIKEKQTDRILVAITYTSSSLSTLALVAMVIVNRRRLAQVTIPLSNLENVAVALVLANIVFMSGTGAVKSNSLLCYGISVALHYLWLVVFSFTSLAVCFIGINLFKVKAPGTNKGPNLISKRRRVTALGLMIPLLFIGAALCVDQYGPNYFSPGYGKAICFPTQFPGNLIFFTGPILITIFINTSCLVCVMIRLHFTAVSLENVRKQSYLSEAKIFLRMVPLSGCFWITGILAVYFESEWLDYVFTIICGSQGLLIAIANVTTWHFRWSRKKEITQGITLSNQINVK